MGRNAYCLCARSGELRAARRESAGALTSWATMTDLLVRLFCHAHTCHSHAHSCSLALTLSLTPSLSRLRFSPLFAQCSPRLKFIWLWPKGDGLWVFRLCRRRCRRPKSAKTNPICYFRLSEWQLGSALFRFAAPFALALHTG